MILCLSRENAQDKDDWRLQTENRGFNWLVFKTKKYLVSGINTKRRTNSKNVKLDYLACDIEQVIQDRNKLQDIIFSCNGKGKGRYSFLWKSHPRATGRHLP